MVGADLNNERGRGEGEDDHPDNSHNNEVFEAKGRGKSSKLSVTRLVRLPRHARPKLTHTLSGTRTVETVDPGGSAKRKVHLPSYGL